MNLNFLGGRKMFAFGKSSCYWGKMEMEGTRKKRQGIVVVFAWMASCQERQLRSSSELYASLGWDSFICHSHFLDMFLPERAATMASDVLSEIVKELKISRCPVVFASFSGGSKACMYKILQIIDGMSEAQINMEECRLVRSCVSGYIYDSSPLDFTSELGTRFTVHQSVPRASYPKRLASWIGSSVASGLNAVFLNRFESQRAEYWQTLYSSVSVGAPYLILCSENDVLAPYQVIQNFAQRLEQFGVDVKLVKWNSSPHIGHYQHHPVDYKAAVIELLGKAATVYSQRTLQLRKEKPTFEATKDNFLEPIHDLRKTTTNFHQGFREVPLVATDHLLLPSSFEYYDGTHVGLSMQDEQKQGLIHLPTSTQAITAHGVLGHILFDVCVPKTVEDWDIRSSGSMIKRPSGWKRRHAQFNPIKCMLRSRL